MAGSGFGQILRRDSGFGQILRRDAGFGILGDPPPPPPYMVQQIGEPIVHFEQKAFLLA